MGRDSAGVPDNMSTERVFDEGHESFGALRCLALEVVALIAYSHPEFHHSQLVEFRLNKIVGDDDEAVLTLLLCSTEVDVSLLSTTVIALGATSSSSCTSSYFQWYPQTRDTLSTRPTSVPVRSGARDGLSSLT